MTRGWIADIDLSAFTAKRDSSVAEGAEVLGVIDTVKHGVETS
ncbi:hypothetical protein [Microbacterium thalassium]|nr:hypothetical protein [Microbacterium thalassium]